MVREQLIEQLERLAEDVRPELMGSTLRRAGA